MLNIKPLNKDGKVAKDWHCAVYAASRIRENPDILKTLPKVSRRDVAGLMHLLELHEGFASEEELKAAYFEMVENV